MDYVRNRDKVYEKLKRVGKRIVAMEDGMRIIFPTRWLERDLATISTTTSVMGFIAVVDSEGFYAVSKVPVYIRTEPDRISNEIMEGEDYTHFHYNKGSSVVSSTDVVASDILVHPVYTELLGRGRIPWYYSYNDYPNLFEGIIYYNGVDTRGDIAVWSYMAATAARDPDNPQKFFRQRKKLEGAKPKIVGLKQVHFHGGNVLAKLGGSYFDAGTTSALANPSKRIERAETMLTMN